MDKENYQKVIENIDQRRVDKLMDFLSGVPMFQQLPNKVFKKLHLIIGTRLYQRGNFVCREGEESNALFIVGNGGEFEVTKVINTYEPTDFFKKKTLHINENLPKNKLIS